MTEQYLPRTINYDDGVSASFTATGATAVGATDIAVVSFSTLGTAVGSVVITDTAAGGTVLNFTAPGQYLIVASLDFAAAATAAINKRDPLNLPPFVAVPTGFTLGNLAFQTVAAPGTVNLTALVTVTSADVTLLPVIPPALPVPPVTNQVRILASAAPAAGTLTVTGL